LSACVQYIFVSKIFKKQHTGLCKIYNRQSLHGANYPTDELRMA